MAYPTYPYNPYNPYYQPGGMPGGAAPVGREAVQPTAMPQPGPMPVQGPMAQVTPNNPVTFAPQGNGIIWVPDMEAANQYLVAANNAVALWDSNHPFVYLKQADSSGKPTLKVFELVERDPNQKQEKTPDIQLPDFGQFVTQNQLEGIIEDKVNDILSERLKKPSKSASKKEDD